MNTQQLLELQILYALDMNEQISWDDLYRCFPALSTDKIFRLDFALTLRLLVQASLIETSSLKSLPRYWRLTIKGRKWLTES